MKTITMKKMLTALLTICPAILFAQTGTYTLKGNLTQLKSPARVYLSSSINGKPVLDSADVKDGKFQFTGQVPGPLSALLILDHELKGSQDIFKNKDKLSIYLAKENIVINAQDSIKNGVAKGSKINEDFEHYSSAVDSIEHHMSFLNAAARKPGADIKGLRTNFTADIKQWEDILKNYARQNPDSYFSIQALNSVGDGNIDVKTIEPLFNGLSDNVRNTPDGIDFGKAIAATKATKIGAMAPDFTQNDVNDKPVKLSDFRGKYVLLDFWASWCGPCRKENPGVVKAFNDFKDKNFTVISISLDRPNGKQNWLKAIEADGLNWTNLSDLKFWDNAVAKQYGIGSVPQNYLIDPTGKIVAIGLRGEALGNKLQEILGH